MVCDRTNDRSLFKTQVLLMDKSNKQILVTWANSNQYMLTFSTIALVSILTCFGFGFGERYDITREAAVGVFLTWMVGGKAADVFTGGDRTNA